MVLNLFNLLFILLYTKSKNMFIVQYFLICCRFVGPDEVNRAFLCKMWDITITHSVLILMLNKDDK